MSVKPPSAIEQKARQDLAEYYASPCRMTTQGTILYFVGWRTQGVTVRRWNGSAWGPEEVICAQELTTSKAYEKPGPLTEGANG